MVKKPCKTHPEMEGQGVAELRLLKVYRKRIALEVQQLGYHRLRTDPVVEGG